MTSPFAKETGRLALTGHVVVRDVLLKDGLQQACPCFSADLPLRTAKNNQYRLAAEPAHSAHARLGQHVFQAQFTEGAPGSSQREVRNRALLNP